MNTLNLIYPHQSDLHFTAMQFPDGQPHLKLDMESVHRTDRREPFRILTRIGSASDLLLLLFAKNTLDYLEFEHIELHIAYLMGARMDRVMQDGEPFSLKVIAAMLNDAAFKKVKIFDPHSEVATALIDRSYAIFNHEFVKDAMQHFFSSHTVADYCLVSPDAGALKKIYKLAHYLKVENVVECFKERDLKTGALSGFKISAAELGGKTCFIVDDLCDGGGTFAGTAALLRSKGAVKIVLIVSHGIFSKGIDIPGIDFIYSTDSFREVSGINCFPVGSYMHE